jgi:glutathione S-transferase
MAGPALKESPGGAVQLYELVLDNGRSASPNVWRSRYALAHKGIDYTSVPLGFTDIPTVFGGRFKTVPVLKDGNHLVAESWDIAEYLDRTRPQGAALFGGASEIATTKLLDAWLQGEVLRRLFRLYALDIHDAARPQDRPYFWQSREKRL